MLQHGEKPIYPGEALQGGIKGDVVLQLHVDQTGKVVRSLAVEGDPLLVAASEEALHGFQFQPYLLQGNPVAVESQIEFEFVLQGKETMPTVAQTTHLDALSA
jgi:periplasmic protein TonB